MLGLATLPMPLAPLGFLIFTYLILPRSSLVGHLSGILVGYLIASGLLDPLNFYWMLSISAWMGIGKPIGFLYYSYALESITPPLLNPQHICLDGHY